MSYKTILVHVDQSRHAATRTNIAADIAKAENAHLIGVAMNGISRFLYQDSILDVNKTILAAQIEALNDNANKALNQFDIQAKQTGVLSYERRLVNDEPEGGLALQSRYADLVVMSQMDADDPASSLISDLPQYVVLNCARPVLIIPSSGKFDTVGTNALVAWDGSIEATHAITNAIPMLQRAKKVTIALFNTSSQIDVHGEQPGADIALYLARHHIKVEVMQRTTKSDIGNALLSTAADLQCDLIVMGGYGHTRFREVLLGGVTQTILDSMTIPVLMSH
jgi:nucleotide-binding universal stress UspA family protein